MLLLLILRLLRFVRIIMQRLILHFQDVVFGFRNLCITCHRNNRRFADMIFYGETCSYCYLPESVKEKVKKPLRYCKRGCGNTLMPKARVCDECKNNEETSIFKPTNSYQDKIRAMEYLRSIGKAVKG